MDFIMIFKNKVVKSVIHHANLANLLAQICVYPAQKDIIQSMMRLDFLNVEHVLLIIVPSKIKNNINIIFFN